jgi:hypothetical protein
MKDKKRAIRDLKVAGWMKLGADGLMVLSAFLSVEPTLGAITWCVILLMRYEAKRLRKKHAE